MPSSYLSPKLMARALPQKGGKGVFAQQHIHQGEVIAVWGGDIGVYDEVMHLPEEKRRYTVQVEEGLYQIVHNVGDAEYINHSCDPNVGFHGQIVLVAMRDIEPGEEACIDYAMCDGSPYDEFACGCGAPHCRQHVTGNDWQLPELQEKYQGYFSAYLQHRIDLLQREGDGVRHPGPKSNQYLRSYHRPA